MTVQALLLETEKAGIRLTVEGDKLRVTAPAGALTPDLREALAEHKTAILRVLAQVEYVTLRGGVTLPLPPLQLAWSLEGLGFRVRVAGDIDLVIEPDAALTPTDRASIERWRRHLIAIVDYQAPEIA